MVKYNRLAALLLAMSLVLATAACDSAPASSSSAEPAKPSSVSSEAPSSSSAVITAPDREYIKGVTTGNEYVSEFWGIKFTSPNDKIILATAEQIGELLGFGTDAMGTDPSLTEELKAQLDLYELAAIDSSTGSMLMLTSAELPMTGISGDIYIRGILEGVKSSGGNVSIELDNDGNSFKQTIAGKEFTCVSYLLKGNENVPDNHQTQGILIDGKRALVLSLTYPPAVESAKAVQESLLAALTPIEAAAESQADKK